MEGEKAEKPARAAAPATEEPVAPSSTPEATDPAASTAVVDLFSEQKA
jgi:hypothetical protein